MFFRVLELAVKREQVALSMNLELLHTSDLLLICEELGIDARKVQRTPLLGKAIHFRSADDKELRQPWELFQEKRTRAERKAEKRKAAHEAELEMKRVEFEIKRVEVERTGKHVLNPRKGKTFKIKDLMLPFKLREGIRLFLVNFERMCNRMGWSRDTWRQLLLTLLPCEASQVVARLNMEEAANYDAVNSWPPKKALFVHRSLPTAI